MNKIRFLRADEVDARVATVSEKGCSILLYKDARCDMNILDECFGSMNWQRKHSRDNANCIVSIWDEDKKQWVEKEDTGTESYTEKEKGLASDSFKRACFNWGIGRELYTAPFIWFSTGQVTITEKNGKKTTCDTFKVTEMEVENGIITRLTVVNNKTRAEFKYSRDDVVKTDSVGKQGINKTKVNALKKKIEADHISEKELLRLYQVSDLESLSENQFMNINTNWEKVKTVCVAG